MKIFYVIGVMSGTSLDGVDLVYVKFIQDEKWSFEIINSKTYKYEDSVSKLLTKISEKSLEEIKHIDREYSKKLADIIKRFIFEFSIKNIHFVSSHGHTAIHDPSNSITYQIGNLPIISQEINQNVICDFRAQDIELGGQGAPLVPVGEKYLFHEYDSFINLGGFANISKYESEKLIAYDICPVNIVLNDLSKKIGKDYDNRGAIASSGKLILNLYKELEELEYYQINPPKSLGIEWVNKKIIPLINNYNDYKIEDLLNTLSNHIANQVSNNLKDLDKVFITGGGAYNDYLINVINSKTNCEIIIPSNNIIEFKEALIFAFLGVLRYLNINNCYSSVTGASKDHCSGKIYLT
ncbi:MAG: anhydro-N-acetylmuramic acid kinase [Flavobacteriaceae bacterium]|nr:anhydro-N-acetylmuramic acid kinase [Flavobacteriaceae bacterium]MDA0331089.1 anhydro-N-acetylmuramic acid kinase [Bacteroidota bacterium]MDA1226058.1 anhydro-N-acetylmuramic acid kinase [Bacteroidota bacterium]